MTDATLSIKDLSFKNILHNINLNINSENFVILLGHNGCGKSTLLSVIDRSNKLSGGEIKLQNKNVYDYKQKEYTNKVVSIHQDPNKHLCLSLTIEEHFKLYLMHATTSQKSILKTAAKTNHYLDSFHPKLACYLKQPVATLSGGEKQMLILALHLLLKPKLLLLDEHTSALDPQTRNKIMTMTAAAIKRHKVTCIMTTHDLNMACEYGNRIVMLEHGKIARQFTADEKQKLSAAELYSLYT